MALFRGDPELATQLMAAMDLWLVEQASQALSTDQAQTAFDLAAWVQERKNLAKISSDLSLNSARSW